MKRDNSLDDRQTAAETLLLHPVTVNLVEYLKHVIQGVRPNSNPLIVDRHPDHVFSPVHAEDNRTSSTGRELDGIVNQSRNGIGKILGVGDDWPNVIGQSHVNAQTLFLCPLLVAGDARLHQGGVALDQGSSSFIDALGLPCLQLDQEEEILTRDRRRLLSSRITWQNS